jgi:GTP-binding protein
VHVLDLAPLDGSDPVANHATVEHELAEHGTGLAELPRILCLSKADLVPAHEAEAAAAGWRERLGEQALEVITTSAATRLGLDGLAAALLRHVAAEPPPGPSTGDGGTEALAEHRLYRPRDEEGYAVERLGPGSFRVTGRRIERLLARHDLENPDAQRYVEERLRGMGVIRALEREGFEPGDEVEMAGTVFELDPRSRVR